LSNTDLVSLSAAVRVTASRPSVTGLCTIPRDTNPAAAPSPHESKGEEVTRDKNG
jgi:hypothetical protein